MRRRLRPLGANNSGLYGLAEKCSKLLYSATGKEVDGFEILIILGLVFLLLFIFGFQTLRLPGAIMLAVVGTALPVLFLLAKREGERNKSSKEALSFVTAFYRQYRINNKNIFTAMEKTSEMDGDFPNCRQYMYRLLLRLRSAGSKSEIALQTDRFSYALGTVWGHMLASCIRLAADEGVDVSEGISDIISQLNSVSERLEEKKRLNSEASRMTIFMVPFLYVGTVIISMKFLNISFSKFIKNQFFTSSGLLIFVFGVSLFIFNLIMLKLIENSKVDY